MKKNCVRNIILALGLCVFTFLVGCGKDEITFLDVQSMSEESAWQEEESSELYTTGLDIQTSREEPQVIMVHVCGAVLTPGVYELSPSDRIIDAVNLAGGLTEDAADDYVNLAGKLSDGEQIFIPTKEEAELIRSESVRKEADLGKVNINTADKALLCTLPGIGETRAESIISYRQENGSFSSIEDIMQVSGIKESSFQKIKEYIVAD